MQAIQIKFYPPTKLKKSRMKAFCKRGQYWMDYDYDLSTIENLIKIVTQLLKRLEWVGYWIGGLLKNDDYVFVCQHYNCEINIQIGVNK
jgi:hypothetical protein